MLAGLLQDAIAQIASGDWKQDHAVGALTGAVMI
jgi:hypothetical protein